MPEPWHIHTACDHCRHEVTNVAVIDVQLRVRYPRHQPQITRAEVVEQMVEALPKEWWWGSNMAEWGLVEIR